MRVGLQVRMAPGMAAAPLGRVCPHRTRAMHGGVQLSHDWLRLSPTRFASLPPPARIYCFGKVEGVVYHWGGGLLIR